MGGKVGGDSTVADSTVVGSTVANSTGVGSTVADSTEC